MSLQQSISKPLGPLPLWGWFVVGGGLIVGYIFFVRGKDEQSNTGTSWLDTTDPSAIQAGLQGSQGPAGPAGEKGDIGETGATGEAGAKGEKGDTGKLPKMPVCKAGYDPYWTGSKWVCRRDNPKKKKKSGNHNDPVTEMTALTMPAPNNSWPTIGYDMVPAPSHYPPSNIAQGDQYSRMFFGKSKAKEVDPEPTDATLVTKIPATANQRGPGRPWYPRG